MEIVQCCPSGTSEDTDFSDSNICFYHCFQHHFGSAPNILSPTRKCYEHPITHQIFPHSTSFPSGHPLHHAHLHSPSIRQILRTIGTKIHRSRIRNLPALQDRLRSFPRNVFHDRRCLYGEEEKGIRHKFRRNHIHLLDHTAVSNLRNIRNAHRGWPNWVLLQAVFERDASIFYGHYLLLLLIWLLLKLDSCFFG